MTFLVYFSFKFLIKKSSTWDPRDELYHDLYRHAFNRNCKITETLEDSISLEFTQQVGNLDVRVIDASTGNNLSKAEVTIYDSLGNEVYRYETTEDILHIILPIGNYVVRQTVTPPNYEATVIDTTIFVVIGGLVFIAGGIVLVTNLRKKKDSH